jgi:hypothetical protein
VSYLSRPIVSSTGTRDTGSRTLTGAKARHTRLRTATNIHLLDRARPRELVEAEAKAEEAPTEVKEEGVYGLK